MRTLGACRYVSFVGLDVSLGLTPTGAPSSLAIEERPLKHSFTDVRRGVPLYPSPHTHKKSLPRRLRGFHAHQPRRRPLASSRLHHCTLRNTFQRTYVPTPTTRANADPDHPPSSSSNRRRLPPSSPPPDSFPRSSGRQGANQPGVIRAGYGTTLRA